VIKKPKKGKLIKRQLEEEKTEKVKRPKKRKKLLGKIRVPLEQLNVNNVGSFCDYWFM